MKHIAIASDHAGMDVKASLISFLRSRRYTVNDLGSHTPDSVDYPDYANDLANLMISESWMHEDSGIHQILVGILICGTGIGMSIAANRHRHIRAALCHDTNMARLTRQHNDANVLVLSGRFTSEADILSITETFLETKFEGGRHQRRIDKIS